jgi:hypothetical protein
MRISLFLNGTDANGEQPWFKFEFFEKRKIPRTRSTSTNIHSSSNLSEAYKDICYPQKKFHYLKE